MFDDKEDFSLFKTKNNTQSLIDQIVRNKIYKSSFWREDLFAATAEVVLEKAFELKYIGGTFGNFQQPTYFLCLILKLLQIKPDIEIILSFIHNEKNKYITILGIFYFRLIAESEKIYKVLEPYYSDYRKIIIKNSSGQFSISYIDEIIDNLLNEEIFLSIKLPRIVKRYIIEEEEKIEPRFSVLNKELEIDEKKIEDNVKKDEIYNRKKISRVPEKLGKKKLDEKSDEYWIELRKRANI